MCNLLKHPQKDTADEKASPVLYESGAKHDDSPSSHNETYPEGRFLEFHENRVCRDFEQDVRDEEHHVCHIVVRPFHIEIFLEALDLCVAEVGTEVDEISFRDR